MGQVWTSFAEACLDGAPFNTSYSGDIICFDRTISDDDGNPSSARISTSIVSGIVMAFLFYWILALMVNRFKRETKPDLPLPPFLQLSNTPSIVRVFGVACTASTLMCMFLWRVTNVEAFYIAYLAALTDTQCFWMLLHSYNTNSLNIAKKPFLNLSIVIYVMYVSLAHGTPAIWNVTACWLKYLVYDTLWLYAIFLVILDFKYCPSLCSKPFWTRVSWVIGSVVLSYAGWCPGVWWKPVGGLFYSIWILFLPVVFVSYANLNDFLFEVVARQKVGKQDG